MSNVVPIKPPDPEEYVMVCPCGCRTFEVRYNDEDFAHLHCAQCYAVIGDPDSRPLHQWFRYAEPVGDEPGLGRTTSVKVFGTDVFPMFWRQVEKQQVAFAALAMMDGTTRTWRSRKPTGTDRPWLRSRMKEMLAMLLAN